MESGYDLRLVIRELARLTRDLLVVRIDASRVTDPELAAEGERDRLKQLAAKFSAEDLMRAFDVLTKAEADIRGSAYPRYHLEMAILRWIHLRKLVPLSDLIQGLESDATARRLAAASASPRQRPSCRAAGAAAPAQPARPPQPRSPVAAARPSIRSRHEPKRRRAASSNGDAIASRSDASPPAI